MFFKRLTDRISGFFGGSNGVHEEIDKINGEEVEAAEKYDARIDKSNADLAADDVEYRELMNRLKKTNMDHRVAIEDHEETRKHFDTKAMACPRFEDSGEIRAAIAAAKTGGEDEEAE